MSVTISLPKLGSLSTRSLGKAIVFIDAGVLTSALLLLPSAALLLSLKGIEKLFEVLSKMDASLLAISCASREGWTIPAGIEKGIAVSIAV